ncbi:hypothetical protein P0Y35_14565 [Kiritimatiellaeota bacterium B1221]|nr:hypothetical protein [Kiritimatiellaeota bacterium B1221]
MKSLSFILFFAFLTVAFLPVQGRDPFWPIGYEPGAESEVEAEPTATPAPKQGKELSAEELRQLALAEAEKIRQSLVRKGTMIARGKVYGYVQDKWVTAGDTIPVEVEGRSYLLEIKSLTSDNIELEPHRALAPLQIQPRN